VAYIQEIKRDSGKAYKLFYYLNKKRHIKYFPVGTDRKKVEAIKKELEGKIALHKSGIKEMKLKKKPNKLTLIEFTQMIIKARKNDVSWRTLQRNEYGMKLLIRVFGEGYLLSDLKNENIEYFKAVRLNEDLSKSGVNKDLENIRTCFNSGVEKEIIEENPVKIKFLKTDKELPDILTIDEMQMIEKNLTGYSQLAFQIIKYTGARRGEICRQYGETSGGLLWSDIDFKNDTIRLMGKNKRERIVPLHESLREILFPIRGIGKIIPFVADTITDNFKEAMRKAGIEKKGSVHILRHTAATYLRAGGADLKEIQDWLGHKDISTTQIYTHIAAEHLKKAIKKLPW